MCRFVNLLLLVLYPFGFVFFRTGQPRDGQSATIPLRLCGEGFLGKRQSRRVKETGYRFCLVTFLFVTFLLTLVPSTGQAQNELNQSAFAQNEPRLRHGLAMHGEPTLPAGFAQFPYAHSEAPEGGRITIGFQGSFDSLNPFVVIGVAPDAAPRFVLQGLMTRSLDEPFTLYPLLAERVLMPDDRSSLTITLHEKARFSDGRPVTAQDVAFSFEALKTHGKPFHRSSLGRVREVVIKDARTVTFLLPSSPAMDQELPLILATMPIFASHTMTLESFREPSLRPLIGSGPYRFADIKPGERIVLQKREDFWARDLPVTRGHFRFSEIRYEYFRDANTFFEAFKTGLLDYRVETDPARWALAYDFPRLKEGRVVRETLASRLPKGMNGFVFNTRKPLFADIRVREAIALLFDADWVNRNLYHGLYAPALSYFDGADLSARDRPLEESERRLLTSFVEEISPAIREGRLETFSQDGSGRDREAARLALTKLEEAGWETKDQLLRRKSDGTPFQFEILVTNRQQERLALHFSDSLKRIGITVRVRLSDDAQFWRRLGAFDFDMMPWMWPISPSPGNEQRNRWGSQVADQNGSLNYAGVRSKAVDAMIEAILAARTREDFTAAVRALDRLLVSGRYVVPLFRMPDLWLAYDNTLQRPAFPPLFGPALELWWRKPAQEGRIGQ
jgi:peptide/nickel transport system substrate-binding protein